MKPIRYSHEPVEPSQAEVLQELHYIHLRKDGDPPAEERTDAATLRALACAGFRIVRTCALCAAPEGAAIPGCPNVATHTVRETRRPKGIGFGTLHLCDPHAQGRKVKRTAKQKADARARRR